MAVAKRQFLLQREGSKGRIGTANQPCNKGLYSSGIGTNLKDFGFVRRRDRIKWLELGHAHVT